MSSYPRAALTGAAAGLAGAAAMAATAKLEQRFTKRPNSYVPGHTLSRLLGLARPDADHRGRNLAMHYGAGAAAGMLRGVMSAANLRGPLASLMHTPVRLTIDQTLENATGVGAPPWTWPRDELVVDLIHKTVFSLTAGAVADALLEPSPASSARRPATRARLKGFA